MNEDLMWKTLSEKKVMNCRIFSVIMAEREAGDGRKGTFVKIDSPDWVVAIPWFLKDGVPHFIMEEQFRHGTATVTREFPAGLVEKGEKAAAVIQIYMDGSKILVEGHAGFAPPGQDIVCAAVSALVQTLVLSLDLLAPGEAAFHIESGKAVIQFQSHSEKSRLLVRSFFVGMEQIAAAYPENVSMTRRGSQ